MTLQYGGYMDNVLVDVRKDNGDNSKIMISLEHGFIYDYERTRNHVYLIYRI